MENNKINILMVDDRPENLLALEAVLSSSTYQLIKAQSGHEALKWVLKLDFAVILLDVQMPGLDGIETAKLIRTREKSKHIPIIFVTALSQSHDHLLSGYSAGAIDYLLKPFHPFVLKSKVEGFVKIYENQKQIQYQNELIKKRTKELEEAYLSLKKSQVLSRSIEETSIDSLLTTDASGQILTVNPTVTTMFGYQPHELLDKSIETVMPSLHMYPVAQLPKAQLIELEAQKKDASLFPVEFQVGEANIDHHPLFVFAIRDITERKNQFRILEEQVLKRTKDLKESEQKYRQLVEESPETIIVKNLNTVECTFINSTGISLLGAESKEDILGKNLLELVHEDDRNQILKKMEALRSGYTIESFEGRLVTLKGKIIDVEVKMIPFNYQGEPSLHLIIRDITELKQSREFIQQSENLTVVGELAAGIAHEIRNPLTSLRGFLQLLRSDPSPNHTYNQIMRSEIDRINTIVSELLLLAKPKKTEFDYVNTLDLLEDSITLMNAQANLHNVEIKFRNQIPNDASAAIYIYGLENKIKQVMINILKNAIEAMPTGGTVFVFLGLQQKYITISIVDQGKGIESNLLSKIGQPFFTTKEKGTGLGLMICHSIIKSHDGKINIVSEEGKGTKVTISLPCSKINE